EAPHPGERAEDAHRHNQYDGKREAPAFILRREYEEDEEHAEWEDVYDGVACKDLLVGEIGPLVVESSGQLALCHAIERFNHLSRRDARQGVAVHIRTREHVVALHSI